jgi:hypothetical protein
MRGGRTKKKKCTPKHFCQQLLVQDCQQLLVQLKAKLLCTLQEIRLC